MASGLRLNDKFRYVAALKATNPPSTSVGKYVSLKDAHAITVYINVANAGGVTGSAITLNQAQAVAGTNAKALGFTWMFASLDTANSIAWTNTAVVSNTFTTLSTTNAEAMYSIEVNPGTLDSVNGFDCFQVAAATGVNTTLDIKYMIYPRYSGGYNSFMNPLVD